MTLTIGGISVAAVTGASFAIASAFNKKNNPGLLDEKSGSSKSDFEIFGPEHFLTKFDSKGGFDHFPGPRRRNDKEIEASSCLSPFQTPPGHRWN